MIIINIILPLLTIAILIYIVINLLRKVEALEDDVDDSTKLVESMNESITKALSRMREVDRLGSFEADDETSLVFTEIQTALDKLNNEINPNGEEKKEEKKSPPWTLAQRLAKKLIVRTCCLKSVRDSNVSEEV